MKKECKDPLGNVYANEKDMCDFWHIELSVFKSRIEQGWSLEEALFTKIYKDHLGNEFESKREMCEYWGISKHVFYKRMKMGWSLKDALTIKYEKSQKGPKKIKDHLDNEFPSITKMCRFWEVDQGVFYVKNKKGIPLEKILCPETCKDHLGNGFKSKKEMCEYWNITSSLFYQRMRNGWTLEESLTIPRRMYIGEYRVAECLKRLHVTFYHDCTIKKIFSDLKVEINWNDFLLKLQKNLETAGIKWTKAKIQKLRPDFVLYTNEDKRIRGVIEFDGEQHQNFVEYFFKTIEEFFTRSNIDFMKQSLWEYMNMPMLRIRHDQVNKIDEMVTDFIENPQKYITNHNTYLSEDEYWSILQKEKARLDLVFA